MAAIRIGNGLGAGGVRALGGSLPGQSAENESHSSGETAPYYHRPARALSFGEGQPRLTSTTRLANGGQRELTQECNPTVLT